MSDYIDTHTELKCMPSFWLININIISRSPHIIHRILVILDLKLHFCAPLNLILKKREAETERGTKKKGGREG